MKFLPVQPPRKFTVGFDMKVELTDCGRVELQPDEQITFVTEKGGEYDVARKDWGFYATPSTNGRLARFGLKTALVKNCLGQVFVLLVETGFEETFQKYIGMEKIEILAWLDDKTVLKRLEAYLKSEP